MKKIRKKILLTGLFVLTFLVFINNGWGIPHGDRGAPHDGREYRHGGRGWGPIPVPVPIYPYYYSYLYDYDYPYPYDYSYDPSPYHPCYTLTLSVINVLPSMEGKSYVMDVIYNGRLLYQAVPQGERRLLRMRSCAYSTDQRIVTIDVMDSDGNFIGTVTWPLYIDASQDMVWNITFNDIQQEQLQQNNSEILEQ
jgi:hypothetical protein